MADCELLGGGCTFFKENVKGDMILAETYKRRYCKGFQAMCARHMVYRVLGLDKVPSGLFPNHQDEAVAIIEKEGGLKFAA